jgi:hypothetical protein
VSIAGVELFSQLGENLYFQGPGSSSPDGSRSTPSLFVVQFQSSTLQWREANLTIHQTTRHPTASDPFLNVTLEVQPIRKQNQVFAAVEEVPVGNVGVEVADSNGLLSGPEAAETERRMMRKKSRSDGTEATISVRLPGWAATDGLEASVNGDPVKVPRPGRLLLSRLCFTIFDQ